MGLPAVATLQYRESGEQRTTVNFLPLCSGQPEVFGPTGLPPSGASFQSAYAGAPSNEPQGLEQALS